MGTRIKIKNVDFSMCGMGIVTDKAAQLSERVQRFIDIYSSYDVISEKNILALSNLDRALESVYGKIRAFYPFIGTKGSTLGLDLINPNVALQGMPAKTSEVYVPNNIPITVQTDSSFYKNIGAIIYNNAPVETSGNIDCILRGGDWFNMWTKITTKDYHLYNAFQTGIYTNSGPGNFGAVESVANGMLAFFAGEEKMVAYKDKAKYESIYNRDYLDDESVVTNTIVIGGTSFKNVTSLSLVVITTGDVTYDEYLVMYNAISTFVKAKV